MERHIGLKLEKFLVLMMIAVMSWQKLKMKVSPPRFLQIGHKKDLEVQFPACLERKSSRQSSLRSKTDKVTDDIFLFPEVSAG